jgi:hypothetical protein
MAYLHKNSRLQQRLDIEVLVEEVARDVHKMGRCQESCCLQGLATGDQYEQLAVVVP